MKKICDNYIPANKKTVEKRIMQLKELGYSLKNRAPTTEEIKKCSSYLDKQIDLIKPKIIVTLGSFSTTYIFEKFKLPSEKISKVHGKQFKTEAGIMIIPVYHPAVATYNPNKIFDLEEDFKTIKKSLKDLV